MKPGEPEFISEDLCFSAAKVMPPPAEQSDPLRALVISVAQRMELSCGPSCTAALDCPHPCPPAMVPLLAYCYAKGIFSSEQIEAALAKDPSLTAFLPAPKSASSFDIRCFRKHHFSDLSRCLAVVIATARASGLRLNAKSPRVEADWSHSTAEKEAESRVNLAIHLDSIDAEDD